MIQLDVYSVGTALIVACSAAAAYENWWYGHELKKELRESICSMMEDKGYTVCTDKYNELYFVKGDIRYSFETIHQYVSEDKMSEIQ